MTDWRPIETAPRDGTVLLVWRESERGYDHARMGTDWFEGGVWQRSRRLMPPTHWMPLPSPPEDGE